MKLTKNLRHAMLLALSSFLLSGCYTVGKVTTSSRPEPNPKSEFIGTSRIETSVISKPDCDDPYLKIKLTGEQKYKVTYTYKKYGTTTTTPYYRTALRVWMYGSLAAFGTGYFMSESGAFNSKSQQIGSVIGITGIVSFVSALFIVPRNKRKNVGKKVYMGVETKSRYHTKDVYFSNTTFDFRLNNKTRTYSTNSKGYSSINVVRDFGLGYNHDYFRYPKSYSVKYDGFRDSGTVRSTLDRAKMAKCIYDNVIYRYVPYNSRRQASEVIDQLIYSDDCFSKNEFIAAVITKLLPFVKEENKSKINQDLIMIGICYLF